MIVSSACHNEGSKRPYKAFHDHYLAAQGQDGTSAPTRSPLDSARERRPVINRLDEGMPCEQQLSTQRLLRRIQSRTAGYHQGTPVDVSPQDGLSGQDCKGREQPGTDVEPFTERTAAVRVVGELTDIALRPARRAGSTTATAGSSGVTTSAARCKPWKRMESCRNGARGTRRSAVAGGAASQPWPDPIG